MKKTTFALSLLLFFSGPGAVHATTYVVEPVLVAQPVYAGMSFYAYQPYNMPKGWYVTFDGFPIVRASSGVWVYGSYNGASLVPTSYVVGSVNPYTISLTPYVDTAQVSVSSEGTMFRIFCFPGKSSSVRSLNSGSASLR